MIDVSSVASIANASSNITTNALPYGFNPNNFQSGACTIDVSGMYVEVFRVIGIYPKLLFWFALTLFLMSLIVLYFRNSWRWLDDYLQAWMSLFVQFSGALTFLLIPVTWGLTLKGLGVAYVVVEFLVYGLGGIGLLWFLYNKVWKNRKNIKEAVLKAKEDGFKLEDEKHD